MQRRSLLPILGTGLVIAVAVRTQHPPGEAPAITPPRVTQAMIASGLLDLREIRAHGLRMFSTPFNKLDGYGDGPMDPANTTSPGGRPTLQNNGTFLRVNGLDSQTCMECHSVLSFATAPFTFGVGGVGGSNNNAMAGPRNIDVADHGTRGFASFDGRYINPPFLFGSGGVELLGKEMTADLQRIKQAAQNDPGTTLPLISKGVSFGSIRYQAGQFDLSRVEGVDPDLVVRPFGRKGEFATTRQFDVEALMFHMGMQPVEVVGADVDADGDGVVNEALVGELSALQIFDTNLERPVRDRSTPAAARGEALFSSIGCAECHRPHLDTDSRVLTYSFPEVHADPAANVYYAVNLQTGPARFERAPGAGLRVPLFSDLKRHDMGPDLTESTGSGLDRHFITARLWGIADTAPYLHDGRALTLTDAILLHGGEGRPARDRFAALGPIGRADVLAFLRTLRTPKQPANDLLDK